MNWSTLIENDLQESAEFAATYLRDALADEEPATVLVALQHVARARGGIDDLGLTVAECAQLANVISRRLAKLPVWQPAPALQAA